jgi:hypothetical protein
VRWDDLFEDLAARLDAEEAAELRHEVADRARRELATLTLLDRLSAQLGERVQVGVAGVGALDGLVLDVAAQWLLLEESGGRQAFVPTAPLLWLDGIGRRSAPPAGAALSRRFGLGAALRGLARQRSVVRLHLLDGLQLVGTLDRVGADHVDLAQHPADVPRRVAEVRSVRVVPLTALALIRSASAP